MKIKEQGQILELDPYKEYWLFIRVGSYLAKVAKAGHIRKKKGQIIFFGDPNEFKFVENSDRIKGIILKEDFEDII